MFSCDLTHNFGFAPDMQFNGSNIGRTICNIIYTLHKWTVIVFGEGIWDLPKSAALYKHGVIFMHSILFALHPKWN